MEDLDRYEYVRTDGSIGVIYADDYQINSKGYCTFYVDGRKVLTVGVLYEPVRVECEDCEPA